MGRFLSGVVSSLVILAVSLPCGPPVSAQAPEPPPTKSVYGKLLRVDKRLNNLFMKEDGGGELAWHFDPPVIAEAHGFKAGDPVIVIYRQTTPKQKRVTAIAFPGTAKVPIYLNMTDDRIVIRSSAGVNGSCNQTSGLVSESTVPSGGLAEVVDECWCCSPVGQACTPGNLSGLGRALLVQCFK